MSSMDGRLTARFRAVGGKLLSRVECAGEGTSNQHELNGVTALRSVLGDHRRTFSCTYVYFGEADTVSAEEVESSITWYDARENHPTRSEYRLVYTSEASVMQNAREGDFCWVLTTHDPDHLVLVVASSSGRAANALDRLLGTELRAQEFDASGRVPGVRPEAVENTRGLDLTEVDVLEALGVEVSVDTAILDLLVERFGGREMPQVREFAAFCRDASGGASRVPTDPDGVLTSWFDFTNTAYIAYERALLEPILTEEFQRGRIDVDRFFELASRFKNRRFSRAGTTFEDHLGALFGLYGVRWHHPTSRLSDRSKPDFLFPGRVEFEDPMFPTDLLTLLGAKTTSKERWAQIVSEGARMTVRHFVTMDRQLSFDALVSMGGQNIVPVVPLPVQEVYDAGPRGKLLSVADFLSEVREKEDRAVRLGHLQPVLGT